MNIKVLLGKSANNKGEKRVSREERVNFAKYQFLELKRKNLSVPVKLFQL